MADDEKSARKYLEGLNSSDAPWLKPLSGSKPERIAKRNRDIAEKTRHLRKN